MTKAITEGGHNLNLNLNPGSRPSPVWTPVNVSPNGGELSLGAKYDGALGRLVADKDHQSHTIGIGILPSSPAFDHVPYILSQGVYVMGSECKISLNTQAQLRRISD